MSWVAVAVGGIVAGVGTGIAGSVITAGSMEDAAKGQQDAAKYAADLQMQQYQQGRADLTPWRQTGEAALRQLAYLLGLPQPAGAAAEVQPGQVLVGGVPQPAYEFDGQQYYAVASGNYSAPGWKKMENELYTRAKAIPGARVERIGGQTVLLAPAPTQEMGGAATKQDFWGEFGQLTRPFEFDQTDPSYQWRLKEGLEAIEQSAAARGGYFSGETGLELERYGQGLASTEYQNEFNRYLAEIQNLYNMLAGVGGTGQTAATSTASMGQGAATNAGNITMTGAANAGNLQAQAAQAMASGYQGASNQLMSGAGTLLSYMQMQDLLKKIPITGTA